MADDFKDDIIIVCDDGTICHISQKDLRDHYRIPSVDVASKYTQVSDLLAQGVRLAAIPTKGESNAAGDMMCYLLNLKDWNRLS